jgi:DNA-binding GntR family transcriptional regulator
MDIESVDMFSRSVIPTRVLNEIRINIIFGKYASGSRLVEANLASELNASRGSIRMAIQALEKEGLIRVLPNGAKQVIGFTKKDVIDMYKLRGLLETEAAKIILHSKSGYYTPLLAVLNEISKCSKGGSTDVDWHELDIKFHRAIMIMADNRALLQAWENISANIYAFLNINTTSSYQERYAKEFFDKHKSILDSIIVNDEKCIEIIENHIVDAEKMTLDLLESRIKDFS